MFACLLIAAAIVPQPSPVVRESVGLIEHNFFYDGDGRLVFEQHIFSDFDDKTGEERVIAWRLVKAPDQVIARDPQGGYVLTWMDGETMRQVRSRNMRTTWLQHDPELIARETYPKELRRELRKK